MVHKKYVLLCILFFSLFAFTGCRSGIRNITYNKERNVYSCEYRGQTRRFILCLPENCENAGMVFMLHGYGGDSYNFKNETRFDETACKSGFAVVYVDGLVNSEISGSRAGWFYNDDKNSKKDIDFLEELAIFLQNKYEFDKENTYIAGFSCGAFLCYKISAKDSKIFKGIISAGGMMPDNVWKNKKQKSKCRVLQINGTKDSVVPMKLNNTDKNNPAPAMEDVLSYFSGNLETECKIQELSERSELRKYSDDVWWLLIKNETHRWPSSKWAEIDINRIILDFCKNN